MRVFKTEGIIIKRKNFGEADRILTVFTKRHGKIKIIAKGVRKITSRRSSHVELLNLSVMGVHEGKIPVLTEAESLNHHSNLKNDLRKTGYAFYICELIDGMLAEHQENRAVFELLEQTLFELEIVKDPRPLIRKFEEEMLILLGFWPKDKIFLEDSDMFIEGVLERRIKTKRILPDFS
ncbi:MAG: DNA repair protein RecO [Candidatus Levybacteria bacterium]|nr:DNA repair protein RecO [Candidatus Levybacteria bacterium]